MIEIKEILTDNKDLEYIKECAESVGMDVTDRTTFSISFIAEVMRRMNKFNRSKEAYNKGYNDGQDVLAFHLELCKEEGSIVTVPDGTTNGDIIKAMFPDKELWQVITSIRLSTFDHNYAEIYKSSWWNSPYRKEQE